MHLRKPLIFINIALCFVLACLLFITFRTKEEAPQILAVASSTAAEESADLAASRRDPLLQAQAESSDTVAWLQVPGTDIDAQVMQSIDNDYYLRRNEQGENDVWGCYFGDLYSVFTERANLRQNTVIYGHTDLQEDPNGARFSQLFRYLDLDFVQKNPYIYVTLPTETLTFAIFAVFFTETNFYYIDPTPSNQGFDEFLKTVQAKNEFLVSSGSITEQDRLLTLSGCATRYDTANTGEHRFVVMAKLLEDETAADFELKPNPAPQRPQ